MGEFDLIKTYFKRPVRHAVLGGGDDCALIAPGAGMQLAISSDMLVEGRHFLSTVDPSRLGHKALAVNLSDLAACGARPVAFTLALSLPRVDGPWIEAFASGMYALADAHQCELIGGDTTQGPLNICITVLGEVPGGRALLRSGACAGDDLYVSGSLGAARAALEVFRGTLSLPADAFDSARTRMEKPEPRVALGMALRGLATSAIDVSDGLLGDVTHILGASGVGAQIDVSKVIGCFGLAQEAVTDEQRAAFTLAGGDDYELAFTAPPSARLAIEAAASAAATRVTRIGSIEAAAGLRLADAQGHAVNQRFTSFDHFA